MVNQPPTVVVDHGNPYWASETIKRFPARWSSPAARLPGGNLYGLFFAIASQWELNNQQLVQAWQCCRIATAVGNQLDVIAQDFYGPTGLPRLANETDSSYAARIQIGLFQPKIIQAAFQDLIAQATDEVPRVINGWIAGETSGFDWSGWDTDTATSPSLWGDAGPRYQGFIIAAIEELNPTYAVYGFDFGAAWDSYLGWFVQNSSVQSNAAALLDALINGTLAFGITIWRKYIFASTLPQIVAVSYVPATGKTLFHPSIPLAVPFTPIASGSWLADYFVSDIELGTFTINTDNPNPSAQDLNYAAIPFNIPGAGTQEVVESSLAVTIDIPTDALGARLMVNPNWQTNVWIAAETGTTVTLAFPLATAPPADADVYYYFFPDAQSGLYDVTEGVNFVNIPVVLDESACPFALPNWNTQVAVNFLNGTAGTISPPAGVNSFTVSVPIPAGSLVIVNGSWGGSQGVTAITTAGFTVGTTLGAPSNASLNYLVIPAASLNAGSIALSNGATGATITPPSGYTSSDAVAVTASWPTNVYITSLLGGVVTVAFDTPAPSTGESLTFYFFSAANTQTVSIAASSASISASTAGNVQFVTANWDTTLGVTATTNDINVAFGTAAPSNAFLEYGQVPVSQFLNVQFDTAAPAGAYVHYGYLATT